MPAPRYKTTTQEYRALREQSSDKSERNDCTVVAIAAATGEPYEKVHAALKAAGRKQGKGCQHHVQEDALTALGYEYIDVSPQEFIDQYPRPHNNLQNVTTHHADRFPQVWKDGQNYLLWQRGHVTAIVDGKNHDWTRGRAKRVWRIALIRPAS